MRLPSPSQLLRMHAGTRLREVLPSQSASQGHATPGYWQTVQLQQFRWVPTSIFLSLLPTSHSQLTPLQSGPVGTGTLHAPWAACRIISRNTLLGSTWACMAVLLRRVGAASLPLAQMQHCTPQAGARSVQGHWCGCVMRCVRAGCTHHRLPFSAGGAASTRRLQHVPQGRHQPRAPSILVRP